MAFDKISEDELRNAIGAQEMLISSRRQTVEGLERELVEMKDKLRRRTREKELEEAMQVAESLIVEWNCAGRRAMGIRSTIGGATGFTYGDNEHVDFDERLKAVRHMAAGVIKNAIDRSRADMREQAAKLADEWLDEGNKLSPCIRELR